MPAEESTETFCPETEDECKSFLNLHYNFLSKRIQTNKFYGHLISEDILDQHDKEEIEKKHLTSLEKAEALIDIIITRGKRACKEFLQVLEYDYPDHYRTITNNKPRRPPSGWRPRVPSLRLDVMSGLVDMLKTMLTKQEKLEEAYSQAKEMEHMGHAASREMQSMEDDLYEKSLQLEKYMDENKMLQTQMQEMKKKETQRDNDMLQLNIQLNSLRHDLKIASGEITSERQRSKRLQDYQTKTFTTRVTSSVDPETLDNPAHDGKHSAEVSELRDTVSSLENKIYLQEEEIARVNKELEEHIEKLHLAKMEHDALSDDYNSDAKRYKTSLQRQEVACHQLRTEYDDLMRAKKTVDENYETLEKKYQAEMFAPSPRPRLDPVNPLHHHLSQSVSAEVALQNN